ncbi:hypothetical protein SAMN04515674_105310 [Pseudarcicella hirudinis]|uniref:Uncharacterized protein n=1 Tax=Pseudarcicella hirudinis TaxID=1079859 RepID=A0A1I5T267_9BACT|nr:hypothetical protein SAMN04515674_105310 [Pseudarcicella hirudinis]
MDLLWLKSIVSNILLKLSAKVQVPVFVILFLVLLSSALWYSVSNNRKKEQQSRAVELQKQVESNLEQTLQLSRIRKQNDDLRIVIETIINDNERLRKKYDIKVDDIRRASDFELQQQLDSLFNYRHIAKKK